MIANVFGEPLERITPESFLAALKSMSVETGRLDFKRHDVSREQVARAAAAMANADGGILAIGFTDPADAEGVLVPSGGVVDISNDSLTGWYSAIHARVHPPMSLEIRGYELPDHVQFLIIRISTNHYAPHELVARDGERSLPVRRGSTTSRLTLAEINALIAQRNGSPPKSWLAGKQPLFPIRPGLQDAKFFGVRFTPAAAMRERRILSRNDTLAIGQIITAVVGHNLSPALQPVSSREWEGYFDINPRRPAPAGGFMFDFSLPTRVIHVRADGEVTVVVKIANEPIAYNYFDEWLKVLLAAHLTAHEVFHYLRVGPRGGVEVGISLAATRLQTTPIMPAQYEDWFAIDFSDQTFADAFTRTVMLCLREDAGPPDEGAVAHTLNETYATYLNDVDLLAYWR